MKRKTIVVTCLIAILMGASTAFATPVKIIELDSKERQANFKPLYPKVPDEWEVVNKKVNGTYVITYLSNKNSVLSISESNFTGDEINKSDATEVINEGSINYYYSPYRNRSGGSLTWVKNGIIFEMNSVYFDRDLIMKYAKTIM